MWRGKLESSSVDGGRSKLTTTTTTLSSSKNNAAWTEGIWFKGIQNGILDATLEA